MLSPVLARRYATAQFQPDLWLWGQRGNDYERQRQRVNKTLSLKDKDILVAGCGTGRDIESWVKMAPRKVVGLDWFSYERAWEMWRKRLAVIAPKVNVEFAQGDLSRLEEIQTSSFDVVGSDAVFEHIQDMPAVLKQLHRILRPGGILYATFGPLWYSWGGDHVSGYDSIESGFNHLLLDDAEWRSYLDKVGDQAHSEHDGRTWIEHDLFSHLRPVEYLEHLQRAGFERQFVSAIIDPRAVDVLNKCPGKAKHLLSDHSQLDLVVTGMTVILQRI